MKELNVTLGLDEHSLENLIMEIRDNLDLTSEIEDEVENKFDEIFEDRFDDKLSEKITEVVDDRIELKIGSEVEHYMQYEFDMNVAVQDALSDSDISEEISNQIGNLLETYNPRVACSVGNKFTEAVRKAIVSIFAKQDNETNELVTLIKESINRIAANEYIEIMKKQIIEEHDQNVKKYLQEISLSTQLTQNNPYTTSYININNQI